MRMRIEDLPQALQLQAYAQLTKPATPKVDPAPVTSEKGLQAAVEKYLRLAGWKYFHMPGRAAVGNPAGWPDIFALGPGARLLLIELKSEKGKLSHVQSYTFAAITALGHAVHVCRKLSEVQKIVQGDQQ